MSAVAIPTLEELQEVLEPGQISWRRTHGLHLAHPSLSFALPAPPDPSWGTPLGDATTQEMLRELNAFRISHGVPPLTLDYALMANSQWKTMNCAGFLYLQHDTPDPAWPGGRKFGDRFSSYYPYAGGENIAYGQLTAQDALNAFVSAGPGEGHYDNIVSTSWSVCGLSAARASNGLIFWEQCFGSQPSPAPPNPNDHTPPTVPGNLRVTSTGPTNVNLAWDLSTDAQPSVGYTVWMDGSLLGTTYVPTGSIQGLAPSSHHVVEVDAFDKSGNHSARASVAFTTGQQPPPPPPPPVQDPPVAGEKWMNTGGAKNQVLVIKVFVDPVGLQRVRFRVLKSGLTTSRPMDVFLRTYVRMA